MKRIIDNLKSHGINVEFIPINKNAYYLTDEKTIIISSLLGISEAKEVLLHEASHALKHNDLIELYNISSVQRSKMENEAQMDMVNDLISESDGKCNVTDVITTYNLKMGQDERLMDITL